MCFFACVVRRRSLTCGSKCFSPVPTLESPVWYLSDWFYVVLTFVVFGFLYLILKGIETFER
jgi:hypothetical protein